MTSINEKIHVRQLVTDSVHNVFETMLSMNIVECKQENAPDFHDPDDGSAGHVSGSVGYAGEQITGAVFVHVSDLFARMITASMLGMTLEEVTGESEVNDVIGEVCNMVAGGLKSSLCDAGLPCAVSTPGIIRGSSFQIEAMPDVELERIVFQCQEQKFMVEVHCKKTN